MSLSTSDETMHFEPKFMKGARAKLTSKFAIPEIPNTGRGLNLDFGDEDPLELNTPDRDHKAKKQRTATDEVLDDNRVPNRLISETNSRNLVTDDDHTVVLNERKSERGNVGHREEHKTREEKLIDFFRECAPTQERLELLGKRWLSRPFLRRLLLYCGPFVIAIEDMGTPIQPKQFTLWPKQGQPKPTEKLITIDHHDLLDYLDQDNNWERFARQMSKAWPTSFGSLVEEDGNTPYFLWQAREPYGSTGTSYICRKVAPRSSQPLLEALFYGYNVYWEPTNNDALWQIMPNISTSIVTMPTIAFLENLFAPTNAAYRHVGFGVLSDWFPIQNTTPVVHSTGFFGNTDWFSLRFNMRACVPDPGGRRVKRFKNGCGIYPESLGFPLKRQAARIPGLSRAGDQFAIEFLVSISLVLRKRQHNDGASVINYSVIAWLDYGTELTGNPERDSLLPALSNREGLEFDLTSCGQGGASLLQFLTVLTRGIDHWRKCWDIMLARIDGIISVQLQDTLDRRRWHMLMFDDSFQLSEQYFTVLQLLRIFQDWIEEVEKGTKDLRKELLGQYESWMVWRRRYAPKDEDEWPLDMEKLEANFDKVEEFFQIRVNPLNERIRRKKEEVESLRDGLFNAASLREALKAKTLNLFIGVFTVVTVFFTPLSFVATFWAIPLLSQDSQIAMPSGFTVSFVAVPALTYLLSAASIVWVWGSSSRNFRDIILPQAWDIMETFLEKARLLLNQTQRLRRKVKSNPSDQEANDSDD
ncbi:hypothetical protein O1611_g1305 [Lasiodiplodia mahajangana]|uniref:Uncharacterized protein n=1 Tax=Lasiodiplodia mahajangana TaxID=1108764 RepID=A0ACC2JXX2_9PEZI|nr:hypothetical protein O1611_g1305 [Lasiodiplodia mahajangana]